MNCLKLLHVKFLEYNYILHPKTVGCLWKSQKLELTGGDMKKIHPGEFGHKSDTHQLVIRNQVMDCAIAKHMHTRSK